MKKTFFFFCIAAASVAGLFAQNNELKDITFDDIFKKGTFALKFSSPLNVMNDGVTYAVMAPGANPGSWKIDAYGIESGVSVKTVFNSEMLSENITPESYEFSADETMLLITSETESIYRHSSKANAAVINISTGRMTRIPGGKVMYPTLSPDNKNLAYVRDNNLYIFELATDKETAVTTDGKHNEVINGAVDWVYEEEFSMSRGFEWNSNGTKLAYYRFDESAVKEFSMDIWGSLYPSQERWKYPKAGEDNSKVDVYIYDIAGQRSVLCNTGSENDQYLPRIKWTQQPGILSIQRMNRTQNHWELLFYSQDHKALHGGKVIISEQSKTYIDISDNLSFIPGTEQFIYTSEKSGYNHIYCYDYGKEKEQQITSGNWDVTGIKGVDEKKRLVYYTSSEVSPTEDHFFVIGFNGKNKKDLVPTAGNHSITMGSGNKYFTDMSSTISSPYSFKIYRTDGKWSKEMENNDGLRNTMQQYRFGSSEFGKLTTTEGNELNYWIIKPHNFDPAKKYPVLMHCYGGPGHNTVRNSYGGRNYLWHQYLAAQGYVVVSVDNRGTGNRGREFKHSTYLQLGKLEWQDQTEAARWFGKQSWVDSSRIGIWGWSFGGYLSSLCISKSPDVFKTAIAVAPVTNWRYYDNIYTERFLQKPQDNPSGYDENSPINFVNGIKGNYLIIHGTGDDNVHFQNSVEMVNAMIKAGVKYDSEFYPNRNHGIGDRAASYHLYRRMTGYILDNL